MKFVIIYLFSILCFVGYTQNIRPDWISVRPKAANTTYHFRVTTSEAEDYEKAYAKAFAMVILETSWKDGLYVEKGNDLQALEGEITDFINIKSHSMRIPINKVCEYSEKLSSKEGVRLYVLWQVANVTEVGFATPVFVDFNDCVR